MHYPRVPSLHHVRPSNRPLAFVRTRVQGGPLGIVSQARPQAQQKTTQAAKQQGEGGGSRTTPVLMCDTDRRYALDRQSACVGVKGGLGIAQVVELMKMRWMDGLQDDPDGVVMQLNHFIAKRRQASLQPYAIIRKQRGSTKRRIRA
ncbi:hypothetical protein V8C37DRAFT_364113 [Trichoderma ceciliae]